MATKYTRRREKGGGELATDETQMGGNFQGRKLMTGKLPTGK
jgi:hypothetical protein